MQLQISELERLLGQLLTEHKRLLAELDGHQQAMKTLRFDTLNAAAERIEASRTRIISMETRRRFVSLQIAKFNKSQSELTILQLAEIYPERKKVLLKLREDLKLVTAEIARKSTVSGKIAGALLGHLNTVVRLIAGAVQQSGVYSKQGVPTVASRIGGIEAVG